MTRFYGNHPGTRQDRPHRKVKPATAEELIASMEARLRDLIEEWGPNHWLVNRQRIIVNRAKLGLPFLEPLKGARPDS